MLLRNSAVLQSLMMQKDFLRSDVSSQSTCQHAQLQLASACLWQASLYQSTCQHAQLKLASSYVWQAFFKGGWSNILRSTGGALVLVLCKSQVRYLDQFQHAWCTTVTAMHHLHSFAGSLEHCASAVKP